jgi:hypothetical protein
MNTRTSKFHTQTFISVLVSHQALYRILRLDRGTTACRNSLRGLCFVKEKITQKNVIDN